MSTGTTIKRMTAEEFAEWVERPENDNKWFELVRGEVIELPPPQRRHGVVCMNVASFLDRYVREHGKGYLTCNDSGVILERDPDTVRGPDVAYYEDADRFEDLHPQYGEVPPRLAVEVLSPSDRADQVTRKISDYLRTGVALVWLIDAEARLVTVYRPEQGQRSLEESDELTGEDILPDFRCRIADLFRLPGERARKANAGQIKPKSTKKRRR
jgi:Uma2 family endonuclease